MWAYLCVPSAVFSQLCVGVSQTAKRPTGIFPISSLQCRLTTKGSEIHSTTQVWRFPSISMSLCFQKYPLQCSLSPLPSTYPLFSLCPPRWIRAEMKSFQECWQTVLYSNLTWARWKSTGMLGIEREGKVKKQNDRISLGEERRRKRHVKKEQCKDNGRMGTGSIEINWQAYLAYWRN